MAARSASTICACSGQGRHCRCRARLCDRWRPSAPAPWRHRESRGRGARCGTRRSRAAGSGRPAGSRLGDVAQGCQRASIDGVAGRHACSRVAEQGAVSVQEDEVLPGLRVDEVLPQPLARGCRARGPVAGGQLRDEGCERGVGARRSSAPYSCNRLDALATAGPVPATSRTSTSRRRSDGWASWPAHRRRRAQLTPPSEPPISLRRKPAPE
jgi:hypothetical protein